MTWSLFFDPEKINKKKKHFPKSISHFLFEFNEQQFQVMNRSTVIKSCVKSLAFIASVLLIKIVPPIN